MNDPGTARLYRGRILHTVSDPFEVGEEASFVHHEDGGLKVGADGMIRACGEFEALLEEDPSIEVVDRRGCLILPTLVDCHIHYPQTVAVASHGEELLDWLDRYIFPEEIRYASDEYARQRADLFFDELIAQGTGAALVFGAHFPAATAIAFEEASRRGFLATIGLTLADRNLPETLRIDPEAARDACLDLIERFHEVGSTRFAVSPRFAPSCTPAMLKMCGEVAACHPTVRIQSHLNENRREIEWVRGLFPSSEDYFGVYEDAGLAGDRTVMAHSLHPSDGELDRMAATDTRVAHCPTSNGFLGSGLFGLKDHLRRRIQVGLGTDVAAGTSYSIFQEMNAAYKTQMVQLYGLDRADRALPLGGVGLLYLATLGGARVLGLDDRIGSLVPGRRGDFMVVDPRLDPMLEARVAHARHPKEVAFILAISCDKRIIREVHLQGRRVHVHPGAA